MDSLQEKYEISQTDAYLASCVRTITGSRKCPEWLYNYSLKKYGSKDNLSRYYWGKYAHIPVGKYTWGHKYLFDDIIKSIGAFCSIAVDQRIVPNGHRMDYVTTWNREIQYPDMPPLKHSLEIGNDVWIGARCILFDHVKIGDGAVIGSGSIVTKNVPPYAVVVGANKILKYRFPAHIIEKLLEMQWWNWPDEKIRASYSLMATPEKFIEAYYEKR